MVVFLGLVTLAYRALASGTTEVEVVRTSAASKSNDPDSIVLSATGYIVAHHTINVNSKVTGRLAWIGVEKGDKVKEGQVLVRLEDQKFRAADEQAPDK
jgi:HlyD family secretion protein